MKILRSISGIRSRLKLDRRQNRKVVFVPTMGALHSGHLALIRKARIDAGRRGRVVVSIFVNPAQFNQPSDLKKYPRPFKRDVNLCRNAGVNYLFHPSVEALYHPDHSTWVNETALSLPLCGRTRPGHFRGVCTVVLKLFLILQPDIAIFGRKDAQQAALIKRMVRDLNVPIQIQLHPLIRESDGLAMSSRNQRLSTALRKQAPLLYQVLHQSQLTWRNRPSTSASVFLTEVRRRLRAIPSLKLDYVELVDPDTLMPANQLRKGLMLAVAVFLGKVRLIDHVIL